VLDIFLSKVSFKKKKKKGGGWTDYEMRTNQLHFSNYKMFGSLTLSIAFLFHFLKRKDSSTLKETITKLQVEKDETNRNGQVGHIVPDSSAGA